MPERTLVGGPLHGQPAIAKYAHIEQVEGGVAIYEANHNGKLTYRGTYRKVPGNEDRLERVDSYQYEATSLKGQCETLIRLIRHGVEADRDGDGDRNTIDATLANIDQLWTRIQRFSNDG